jgi:phenylacetate-CoA ligase
VNLNRVVFAYGLYYPVLYARSEPVWRYLKSLEVTQWAPSKDLAALQHRKLIKLLDSARSNVPFYRERIQSSGQALETLPFLQKADLQASPGALSNGTWKAPYTLKTTGGSTGQAVTIRKSREATAWETAANWRGFGWAGIRIGDRQARFWGVPFKPRDRLRARITDFIAHRRRCSAFAFSEADLAGYTRMLERFKPRYLYGYVSMLEQYARYIVENRLHPTFQPVAVITTAEVLASTTRQLLQEAFGCPVFNEYGCGELGTIAHECEAGALHLNAENLLIEVISGDRRCAPGEVGEIVATELNNLAMPLIRYRLGDFGTLAAHPCSCGRTLPVLESIAGRGYDLVYDRQGRMFHGEYFMYMFEEVKRMGLGVQAFQVVQDSYDDFTIRVVPGAGYSERTREMIRTRFREGYGPNARISFVEVPAIARRPSGKMQVIVGLPQAMPAPRRDRTNVDECIE